MLAGGLSTSGQACVSQKTRKLYGPEKPFVKLRPAYFVKLVFSYVAKGIKIEITAKFRDTEHLHFEDTKGIMSPEKFRTVSRKSRELFGPEKLVVKLQSTCFEELIFLHVFNIRKT